ncbi:DinB family protein [Rhabdobacter roseus]|uniref:Putative damage-inducible protein DinB n=1 Tax=Rhabdobacter roseus TaxID=1655419 RepID=A0A840TS20_9BACT|nr:DinB family protein [Rhabdobacter roseus]MBB5286104.1 putative damage-inducible protein DinB [Rhabdobacter roseus]
MTIDPAQQYEWVQESRQVLLDYCGTLAPADFVQENSTFGRGSIRNLLVHVANVYEFWIGKHGLKKDLAFTPYEAVTTMADVTLVYASVDALVSEFLRYLDEQAVTEISFDRDGSTHWVPPLKLFTHVVTHEFHHKGQVLSLSRHLGYLPVDTDVIR